MKRVILFLFLLVGIGFADYKVASDKYTVEEIAQMGQHPRGHVEIINKQGYNTDVDATYETVQSAGGKYAGNVLTSATATGVKSGDAKDSRTVQVLQVVSDSASDNYTLDTSLTAIIVKGFNELGAYITENVTMNGTTTQNTVDKFEYFIGYTLNSDNVPSGEIKIANSVHEVVVTFAAGTAVDTDYNQDKESTAVQGVGVGVVYVRGLDADYADSIERVLLNGTTVVDLQTPLIRVNEVYSGIVGSELNNAGAITVTTDVTTMAIIPAGLGLDQGLVFTVPAGNNAMIVGSRVNHTDGATPNIRLKYKKSGESWRDAGFRVGGKVNILFEEKTEIEVLASGANTDLEITLDILLYKNN